MEKTCRNEMCIMNSGRIDQFPQGCVLKEPPWVEGCEKFSESLITVKWFQKGRESVLRDNPSGCACKFDEDGTTVLSPCLAHKEWKEAYRCSYRRKKLKPESLGEFGLEEENTSCQYYPCQDIYSEGGDGAVHNDRHGCAVTTRETKSSPNNTGPLDWVWNDTGKEIYVFDDNKIIAKYELSVPYDFSTATYVPKSSYHRYGQHNK